MTLAVLFALQKDQWKLTTVSLYGYYKTLYEETINKFGVERAGYGSISKLLTIWQNQGYDTFKTELIKTMLTVKKNDAGDDAPGNATVMRVCPIIFSPPETLVGNALINSLDTPARVHSFLVRGTGFCRGVPCTSVR